ncbi:MAG: DcuS/MalK family sensor histidine kinase [Alicyclobacillus sp.]|nr:DcuS/MalK family sensor histidine kinase [Alicyclobacillus sp.]
MKHIRHLSLQTVITLLVCLVVGISIAMTGVLIGIKEAANARNDLADKAMDVAEMTAHTPLVIAALDGRGDTSAVEPFTTTLERATHVRFIVVMNMHHIRLSHPNEALIGKPFVGGDEFRALHGQTYVSVATGTLGPSMRAFVPVRDANGRQVGVVSVGIMMDKVDTTVAQSEGIIYLGAGVGALVGIVGAVWLSRRIKRTLFGLEPYEIARLWEERNAMLEAVREGILAVDRTGTIVVANATAKELFRRVGLMDNPVGQHVEDYLPPSRLRRVLESGTEEVDQELEVNGRTLIVNRVPVTVNRQVVGAIATFRDKSELKSLMEQLTGVKRYADALRAQAHEFMNKLHVILGIVRLQRYDQLSAYVEEVTHRYQLEVGSVTKRVKDPALAGFLLSKMSYARERGVDLNLGPAEAALAVPEDSTLLDDLITIVGNLVDNALEAVASCPVKQVDLELLYRPGRLTIRVADSGGGIRADVREQLFEQGVSTKGDNRGFGLYLVLQRVRALQGTMDYTTGSGGTVFTVVLPYPRGGDAR